jgi:hypothetical protein
VKPNAHSFYEVIKKEQKGPHFFLDPDCYGVWQLEMQKGQGFVG